MVCLCVSEAVFVTDKSLVLWRSDHAGEFSSRRDYRRRSCSPVTNSTKVVYRPSCHSPSGFCGERLAACNIDVVRDVSAPLCCSWFAWQQWTKTSRPALYFNVNVYDENVNLSGENILSARNPDALLDMDVCVAQNKSWYLLDRVSRRGIRGAFPDQ